MDSAVQVRVNDKVKLKSDVLFQHNPYVPMSEAELLEKLEKSREQGNYRDADAVISDMREILFT